MISQCILEKSSEISGISGLKKKKKESKITFRATWILLEGFAS